MADSNYSKSSQDKDFAQDDPFAELTRIMGHDPRPASKPEPVDEDRSDDLALELENELMGDLMGDDDAVAESASDESQAPYDAAEERRAHWPSAEEQPKASASHPENTFDPSQLSAIFEEAFSGDGSSDAAKEESSTTSASQEDEPREPAERDFEGARVTDAGHEHQPAGFDSGFSASSPVDEPAASDPFGDAAQADAGHDVDMPRETHAQEAEGAQPDDEAGQPMRFVSFQNAAPLIPALAGRIPGARPQAAAPQQVSGEAEAQTTHAAAPDDWHDQKAAHGDEMEVSQPEVDTVDVPGEEIAATDNLDLPEVRYDEETAKSELDEIEELLAGAFNAPGVEPEQPREAPAAESVAPDTATDSMNATDWSFDDEQADIADNKEPAGTPDEDDFAFESLNELRDQLSNHNVSGVDAGGAAMAASAGARPPRKSGRGTSRRALWGSAAVLCLLLAGGAAMYFGVGADTDSGAVIVQADDEPVKVKPDDPGGTTIPNQDNQVYKRVSGEDAQPEPSETRLVSTAEEPVDLPGVNSAQNSAPEAAAPETAAPAAGQQAQSTLSQPGETSAKIDDRLQNTIAEETSDSEVAALEPRRVRSLVVRPDGSMVPREMPEPEVANPAAASGTESQSGTADNGANQQAATTASENGAQTATEAAQTGADKASQSETAAAQQTEPTPVPVSRPANPQPATQAQEPAATQQQPQVAAADPQPTQPAAAAPTSEWSVQIASQPSVEGAQQSYQQLAQRYGNLLEGRGVNIVKAEISGKGTYYRVRIPSSSKDEAIRLCEQLKSAGGNCFVSK